MTATNALTSKALTVVTMRLGRQHLAIPAANLREILDPLPVTRVPTSSSFVWGVVNVRGAVVPLADLRIPFGLTEDPQGKDLRMLVLDIELAGEPAVVVVCADAVDEVLPLDTALVEPLPATGSTWDPSFVRGIFRKGGGFVILPHLPNIFASATVGAS
ncbi:chemotaxis protein CheW [Plastorhodobacter daqingensis]|uniref:Chemotaxis protein CheW n=1 Tax=Plastorhodobacter daqingensis TaxID=1387281 RepID=A0ABW2ULK8_9RHOB